MSKKIILKNNIASLITITDLGIKILQNESADLDWSDVIKVENSDQLKTLINNQSVILNDGISDLSIVEALDYINIKTDLNDYYNKTEADTLLTQKANQIHTHNDLYYTESEVDNIILNMASYGIKGAVDYYSELPVGNEGEIYIVRYNSTGYDEGFYRHNGTSWIWLSHNVGTEDHNQLSGLNVGDYQHLTSIQKSGLTTGTNTTLHSHDARYYTESEMNTLLLDKSNVGHVHDDRYYTKSQLDTTFGNITYSTISANDASTNVTGAELEMLTNGSNADSLHIHAGTGTGGGTLDDAYGAGGVGRIINVDWGPVELRATAGFAPLRLQEINYVPDQWLSGGEICFYDQELFYRDTNRIVWLSIASYQISGALNQSNVSDKYLELIPGAPMNSNLGWTMPWKGVITSISFSNDRGNAAGQISIRRNGQAISQASLWYSGYNSFNNECKGLFEEGDTLQIYVEQTYSSGRPHRPIVWAAVKRRI